MFTAYWEVVNEDREDYRDCGEKKFNNYNDAAKWLDAKDDDIDYGCVITDETGRIIYAG